MRLPDCQNKLIESVCKVQSNVVVVLHNGSPIEMPWLGKVKAVLELYAGGQGVGEAAINLLYGKANLCGKLPESFPHKFEDNPSYLNFPGDGNVVEYREGVFVGYRYYDTKKMDVLFPFGHGLSYTSFGYSNLRLDKIEMQDSGKLTVRVDITNNGIIAGKEIVQLYVSDTTGTLLRPVKELKGFEKLELDPGETKTTRFTLDKRSFAWYSTDINDWYCASGEYRILIGASSRDIRMSGAVKIVSSASLPFKVTMNTLMENIWRNPNLADEAEKLLRKGSPKIEEFMSGNDEISLYLREELMELPFHAIRGLYCVSHADLEAIIERLNAILKDTD